MRFLSLFAHLSTEANCCSALHFRIKAIKEGLHVDQDAVQCLCWTGAVDRISSAVLRGVSHEGRLIGRDACNREQEGNRDTRVRQVHAVSTT